MDEVEQRRKRLPMRQRRESLRTGFCDTPDQGRMDLAIIMVDWFWVSYQNLSHCDLYRSRLTQIAGPRSGRLSGKLRFSKGSGRTGI